MLVSFQFSNSNLLRNNSYINTIQSPFKVYNLVGVCGGVISSLSFGYTAGHVGS